MTISIGRIVHVEFPGVITGAKPGIVTTVHAYDSIDVTVFGAGDARGSGTKEYRNIFFSDDRPAVYDSTAPFAYYPPRPQHSAPPVAIESAPQSPTAESNAGE